MVENFLNYMQIRLKSDSIKSSVIMRWSLNIIYLKIPDSLYIPSGQIGFLDLIIYSLDTMTTGGNSAVKADSTLVQGINTANVFTAIIWMTVMLAATIAYTSESFSQISKKHRRGKKNGESANVGQTAIKPMQ